MKKLLISLLSVICISSSAFAAPDIRDLLGSLAGGAGQSNGNSGSTATDALGGALGGLIQGLIGNKQLTAADLSGVYSYQEPAITFKSDNLLQKAGGAAMAAPIVNKLAPYYEKAGMRNLVVTINPDNTFEFALNRIKLSGTFAADSTKSAPNQFVFVFKALKSMKIGQIDADVQKQGNSLILTFDASKLLTLMNSIAKLTGKQSIQAAASLLNSYDGLNCGFSLARTGDSPKAAGSVTASSRGGSGSNQSSTSKNQSSNSSGQSSNSNSQPADSTPASGQNGLGTLLEMLKNRQ